MTAVGGGWLGSNGELGPRLRGDGFGGRRAIAEEPADSTANDITTLYANAATLGSLTISATDVPVMGRPK